MGERAGDREWLRIAIELSRRCPPSAHAYSVGAVVVAADGRELARGYSRELDPLDHAEEAALRRIPPDDPALAGATLYSSLEPCARRLSRPVPCMALIVAAGLPRVVYAWREPPLFVAADGARHLRDAGLDVVQVVELATEAEAVNAHLQLPGA